MAATPINSNSGLATMEVLINGSAITDSAFVLSAAIQLGMKKGNTATVVITGGIPGTDVVFTSSKGKIPAGAIAGDVIEIRMGYENNNITVFNGDITSITAKTSDTAGLLYYINCQGLDFKYSDGDITAIYGDSIINFDFETEKGGAVCGNLTVPGTNLSFPGTNVYVRGVWVDEEKQLPITDVHHEMADGNWQTTVFIKNDK